MNPFDPPRDPPQRRHLRRDRRRRRVPPAPRQRCCSPAADCARSCSTAPRSGATRCRPTPSCAAACCSSAAGACSTRSSPPARPPCAARTFQYADQRIVDRHQAVARRRRSLRTATDGARSAARRGAAADAGAEVHFGTSVTDLMWRGRSVVGVRAATADGRTVELRAPLVIGADGIRSTIARHAGARSTRVGRRGAAATYGYWTRPRRRRLRVDLPPERLLGCDPHQRRAGVRVRQCRRRAASVAAAST